MMVNKACITCKKAKALRSFWRQASSRDGLQGECKACMRVRTSNWYKDHKLERSKSNVDGINKDRQLNPTKAWLKGVKDRARVNKIPFNLTQQDLVMPEFCPVLGTPLTRHKSHGKGGMKDNSPSIDRLDNNLGYEPGNIVVVSMRVNRIKSNATVEELRLIADWYHELTNGRKTTEHRRQDNRTEVWSEPNYVPALLSFSS